jgi:hypothetical protein
MAHRNPKSTAAIAGHPLHPMLIPFLVSALVADIVMRRSLPTASNSSGDGFHRA